MPKIPIDYSQTIIYKIQHIEIENLIYVGHTTNFNKRKTAHKYNCSHEDSDKYDTKVYAMIRDNGGWDMFKMIQIKVFSCINKREAEAEEDKTMRELKASMNQNRAILNDDDKVDYRKIYNMLHKEDASIREKQYRNDNKELIKVKRATKIECECGSIYNFDSKARHLRTDRHLNFILL